MRAVPGLHTRSLVVRRARSFLARVRAFNATQIAMHARMALLDEPWREEVLHWSHDGDGWCLHGHRIPPAHGRVRSVTRGGWCPGREPHRPGHR